MSILIDDALTQAFIDGSFGLPIAHENQHYSPTAGTAYAEIFVAPNPKFAYSLSETDITSGVFRVILRYPTDEGAITAKQKAEEIIAAYPISSLVTAGAQSARITQVTRDKGYPEEGWFKLVVTIFYEAFIAR